MIRVACTILGGGITGLACAYELARGTDDFLLVEREDRGGGTIRTERVGELLLDAGPDAILAAKPEALALARELGLGERIVPTDPARRRVYVWHRGRLHPLPEGVVLTVPTRLGPLVRSRLFSPWGKLRMALEPFVPARRDEADESIGAFVRRRLGAEAVERLAEPLMAGIHCGDVERLSMGELFPRFVAMEREHGSLVRALRRAKKATAGAGPPPAAFVSFVGGLGELVDALVARLPASSLRFGDAAVGLERQGDRYMTRLASGETVVSPALVLAAPLREAERLAGGLSGELAGALGAIPTVSTVVVFLAFARHRVEHPLDGYGLIVPRSEGKHLLAATFVSTKFPHRAPPSHVLLRAFFGGARSPELCDWPDERLVALARAELAEALGPLGEPELARVYRWRDRTPQMEVGHAERRRAVDAAVAALPRLAVASSGLRGVGIPDCIAEGRRAAAAVVRALAGAHQSG